MAEWNRLKQLPNLSRVTNMRPAKLRRPVPDDWREIKLPTQLAPLRCWVREDGLKVLVSTDDTGGDQWWFHVSISREDRYPDWDDLKFVKDIFIGRQGEAIQVLPADRDYVNVHPNCFHLWSPENG
jgi:hypothetical protein